MGSFVTSPKAMATYSKWLIVCSGRRKRSPVESVRGDYDVSELLAELAATHSLPESSTLQETTYPGQDLSLQQELLEEQQQEARVRGEQIQAGERPEPPSLLYGLGAYPHPRLI